MAGLIVLAAVIVLPLALAAFAVWATHIESRASSGSLFLPQGCLRHRGTLVFGSAAAVAFFLVLDGPDSRFSDDYTLFVATYAGLPALAVAGFLGAFGARWIVGGGLLRSALAGTALALLTVILVAFSLGVAMGGPAGLREASGIALFVAFMALAGRWLAILGIGAAAGLALRLWTRCLSRRAQSGSAANA